MVNKHLNILHLEDLKSDAELVEREIRRSGLSYSIKVVSNRNDFLNALRHGNYDLILSDHSLPSFSSIEALVLMRSERISLPFILITSTVSEEFAVNMMKEGIDDYILKDRLQRLPTSIEIAMRNKDLKEEKEKFLSEMLAQKKKFKALIEHSHDCIALLDERFRTHYVSASVYQKLGIQFEEFDQLNGFGQVHPADQKLIELTLQAVLAKPDESLPITFRSRHQDGHYLWLSGTARNMLNAREVQALVINFRDITANKQAEEALLQRSRHYKALIENITDCILLANRDGLITYSSPSLQLITGLREEDTYLKAVVDFCHKDYKQPFLDVFQHAMESPGIPQYGSLRIQHKNGSYIWVEGTFNNLLNDPAVQGIIMNFRDITERKMAEMHLKKSQATLLTVVNNAELSYVLLNKRFEVVSFNERAQVIYLKEFGKELKEGAVVFDYLPENRKYSTRKRYLEVLNKGKNITYETHFEQRDGSINWYSIKVFPINDENNDLIGLILSTEDITQRKNAEIEKEKMTADLIQHNKNLEQFAYIISHNLRAPVANILGLAYVLDNAPSLTKYEVNKSIRGLVSSVRRMDEVIADLNQILQKRQEIREKKQQVSFPELLEAILVLTGLPDEESNIQVHYNFKEWKEFFTVKSFMHSIFYNLINNSIKYRQPDKAGEIKIESLRTNKGNILRFTDNGIGFDMGAYGEKIFGLYKKFHTHVEGKGIGLYLVKTQVELLGGRISVESAVNKGTTFTLEFPLEEKVPVLAMY